MPHVPLEDRAELGELIEDARCAESPLYWAQNWTATENPHYAQQGLEFRGKFPKKSYFQHVFDAFSNYPRLLIPKSREMLTSWCAVIYGTHHAQWLKSEVVIQCQGEEKATRLISYAECLYRNQPEWLKARHPLKSQNTTELGWADGGRIVGIPKGVHQIRSYHPTIVIFDECAFLEEFAACWNTAHPVAKQMIGVSSAGPGPFADMCAR